MQIRGKVRDKASGQGMENVLVSNGEHVVSTDGDGSYVLQAEHGTHPFVWVSTPDGFTADDRFYGIVDEAGGDLDFDLTPAPEREGRSFRLAQITDTHLEAEAGGRSSKEVLIQALRELESQAEPDLIIHSGDLTNIGSLGQLRHFHEAIEAIETPVFPLLGNHDGGDERRSRSGEETCTRNYGQILGPAYYSFNWGGYHFALYADVDAFFSPADQQRKAAWLRADLARQPPGRESVVVVHMPPAISFVEQLSRSGVVVLLYGHWHSSRTFSHSGVAVAATPPLCFGGIDTEPRGHRLLQFSESGVESVELRALQRPSLRPTSPAAITLENGELPLLWERRISSQLHRAAPVRWEDNLLVSLRCEDIGAATGLCCLDATTGERRWEHRTDASVKNSAAVSADGLCALISSPGRLYLLDAATGSRRWEVDLPEYPSRWIHLSPAIADGAVYAGAKAGYGAYELDSGRQQWYTPLDSSDAWPSYATPVVFGPLLIVLQQGRGLLALERRSGEIVWEREFRPGYQYGAPVLVDDLLVSGGAPEHLVVLRAASGETIWEREGLEKYPTGLAAGADRIFATTPAGQITCFDLHTGELGWRFQTGDDLLDMTPYSRGGRSLLAAPVRWRERVIVGGLDGVLYILDAASGACVSETRFGAPISAAPCLMGDGLCVGTWDGRLYCFGG